MLTCTILKSENEVAGIASEWQELHEQSGNTPFSSYEWYNAWWQTIAKRKGKNPVIVTGRKNGRLVALLALSVQSKKGIRVLQGIAAEAATFCEALVEEPEFAEELWKTVYESSIYDFAIIKDVPTDSPTGRYLGKVGRKSMNEKVVTLDNKWKTPDEFMASLKTGIRRNTNRYARHLMDKGPVKYNVVTSHPVPHHIIDEMIDEKIKWGQKKEIEGIFSIGGGREFFHKLADSLADKNALQLAWIECGGDKVVYSFGFMFRDTLYLKMLSTRPEYLHFSPGNMITKEGVCWAIERNYRTINFGLGSNAYKYNFSNNTYDFGEWVFASSLAGKLAAQIYIAHLRLKEVREASKDKKNTKHASPQKDAEAA